MSDILDRPVEGKRYKTISGDTINSVSLRAYGVTRLSKDIISINPFLSKRQKDDSGNPVLYAGDILRIPVVKERKENKIAGKAIDEMTVYIEGVEVPVLSASYISAMDTGADGFKFSTPWIPGENEKLDKLFLPFSYPLLEMYIGNEIELRGYVYGVHPSLSENGSMIELTAFSLTKDAVDSTINPPYEFNNMILKQIATKLLKQVEVKPLILVNDSGAFDKVTAQTNESIFSFLARLGSQRGVLVSNARRGSMIFHIANTTAKPLGTLREGEHFAVGFEADYDGSQLFHTYKAISDTPGGDAQTQMATDDNVPRSRMITFTADNVTAGNIKNAAEWKRSRAYADALSFSIPVVGWIAPDGSLLRVNVPIIVESPTLFLPRGVKLMIKQIEYTIDNSGKQARLDLVPPETFTGKPIEYPWSTL